MKKLKYIVLLGAFLFAGCTTSGTKPEEESEQLQIVTTLFPQYDFTRTIVQGEAEVTLLIQPGVDSHLYEPTPADIIKIQEADVFIYTGDAMEVWAKRILDSIDTSNMLIIDVSQGITLIEADEEHDHDGHNHGEVDPHIWTSPVNAIQMVKTIETGLSSLEDSNKEFYQANAEQLVTELTELYQAFHDVVNQAENKVMVFGSRYSSQYFVQEYGITVLSAYTSDVENSEPSIQTIQKIIDYVKENEVPVIFYQESSEMQVIDTIANETGAKKLLFHSCHNLTKSEAEEGKTYLSLMWDNLEHLKEAFGETE